MRPDPDVDQPATHADEQITQLASAEPKVLLGEARYLAALPSNGKIAKDAVRRYARTQLP
jgi:hypothetical protein